MKDKILMTLLAVIALAAILSLTPDVKDTRTHPALASPANQATSEIKMVTPSQYETEMAGQVLIQLCKPEDCNADKAMLEGLPTSFIGVKFVQMATEDNREFVERLEREREQVPYSNIAKPTYPLYIFKGADLQVAPEIKSQAELRQFIEMNASYERPSDTPTKQ